MIGTLLASPRLRAAFVFLPLKMSSAAAFNIALGLADSCGFVKRVIRGVHSLTDPVDVDRAWNESINQNSLKDNERTLVVR